jgi:hypothetical protein
LLPPTDYYFLYEQEYISATYARKTQQFKFNSESSSQCEQTSNTLTQGQTPTITITTTIHSDNERKFKGNDGDYRNDFVIVEDMPQSKVPWIPVDPDQYVSLKKFVFVFVSLSFLENLLISFVLCEAKLRQIPQIEMGTSTTLYS